MRSLLPALVFLVACKGHATKPSSSSAEEQARHESAPVKDAEADPPKVKPGERVKLSAAQIAARETYRAAIARGRAATIAKRYDEAIEAYRSALDKRPDDARALAERGYAELLANKLDAAANDLSDAVSHVVNDDDLLGQAFFNEGLVYEKKGDAEAARVWFARAASIRPSAAVERKLAGRSRCTAEIRKSTVLAYAGGPTSEAWVANWREALSVIESSPTKLSEADAKKEACVVSSGSAAEPPTPTVCDGAGPWRLSRDHMMYHDRTDFITPHGARMLVVHAGMIGGYGCGPDRPGNSASADAHLEGDLLVVRFDAETEDYVVPEGSDAGDEFECRKSATTTTMNVYDLSSDKEVTISSPLEFPSVTFAGKVVVVSGEGCSERIDVTKP